MEFCRTLYGNPCCLTFRLFRLLNQSIQLAVDQLTTSLMYSENLNEPQWYRSAFGNKTNKFNDNNNFILNFHESTFAEHLKL
jgi:hypothetical protein